MIPETEIIKDVYDSEFVNKNASSLMNECALILAFKRFKQILEAWKVKKVKISRYKWINQWIDVDL